MSYMLENVTSDKMLFTLLGPAPTMMEYLKKTKMCNLSVWATEMEITATAYTGCFTIKENCL